MARVDREAPILVDHVPRPTRPARRKANDLDRSGAHFALTRDGRPHMRGHRFKRSEARKIVPKRRFDLSTPHGLLKRHAYTMDVTRAQMAAALRVSVRTLDGYFGYTRERLKPWMVDTLTPLLALTAEDVARIHEAGVATLGWEPRA